MTPRKLPVVLPLALAAALAGCVERGGWKSAPGLERPALTAREGVAGAKIDAAACPAEGWWRGLGDPQLDALVDEALAGSPSLEVAQARLRAAQGDAIAAGAARLPAGALDAETTRQRYPEHGLFPPPYAGSYVTDARLALDFSFEIDFRGRNRALLAAARSGVAAAEAEFYPNVNLTAFAGAQSIGLSQLFQASDRIVGAGPAVHLPAFNRATLRGALRTQQAQLDQSVGEYNQTLLDAVREVADVVANWRALERETTEQQIALEAAQRSYDLTSARYRTGLCIYLFVP